MSKRTRISLLQNAAIILLSISALFLLFRVLSYETGDSRTTIFSELFGADSSETAHTAAATDLTGMAAPFHLVITGPYGRSGILPGDAVTTPDDAVIDLLREALGSAEQMESVGPAVFRNALSVPGIFIDYLSALDAGVVSGRLNAVLAYDTPIRYLLVAAEGTTNAALYLWDGGSSVSRFQTAVSVSALHELTAAASPDDTFFAFEGGEEYAHLAPYSLMRHTALTIPVCSSALPSIASDMDALLALLDFNVHTESRYKLSNGTEVVVESPRTVRLQSDGVLLYEGDESVDSELFIVSCAGDAPTAAEAVLAARQLIGTLFSAAEFSATQLYLSSISPAGNGFDLEFHYMVNGIPVSFSDETPALRMEIRGRSVTAFTLRWRQYTLTEESYTLLPVRQAAAIAANFEQPFMTIGYADSGLTSLLPAWLAR